MSRDFDPNEEAKKITRLADNAAFGGTAMGNDPLIEQLACEIQKLQPVELRSTLAEMRRSNHFDDIAEFYGDDRSLFAIAFNEKNGNGVVAEIKDPITGSPKIVCSPGEIQPFQPTLKRALPETDI